MTAWSPQPHQPPTREQVEAAIRPALPTVPAPHHAFYRTARNAWWKPLLVLGVFVVWFIVGGILGLVAGFADGSVQRTIEAAQRGEPVANQIVLTPALFLANNLGVAAMIPLAMLGQWAIWGQRPRWLSSVAGGFRWGWFARCMAVAVPVIGALVAFEYLAAPPGDMRVRDYTVFVAATILLTTPLQAAGEEYFIRGLVQRATASWFAHPVVGWVVSTVVGGLVFVSLHLAADPWLNIFYFLFGVAASWVTWRTGGLEAAVAIHTANNMLAMTAMPFIDFSNMLDRSVGQGSPAILLHAAIVGGLAVVLALWGRRRGLAMATAPGASEVDAAHAAALQQWGFPPVPPQPIR